MNGGFPGGSDGKESASNAGNLGAIPGLGRSPGGGHGNPFQYSFLENPHGQRSLAGSMGLQRVSHDWVTKQQQQQYLMLLNIFCVLVGYLCVFFSEMSIQMFCSFLSWVIFLFTVELCELLHILWILVPHQYFQIFPSILRVILLLSQCLLKYQRF